MVFAIAIAITFELLCSTLSFWKVPGDFAEWYFAIFFTMLSGAVVPLWFFPPWLLTIAKLLPFQAIFFIPAQIYMGKLDIKEITLSLGTQAAWVILLLILHEVLWRRGMKRLTIEGG